MTSPVFLFDIGHVLIHVNHLQIAAGFARASETASHLASAQLLSSLQQWNTGAVIAVSNTNPLHF